VAGIASATSANVSVAANVEDPRITQLRNFFLAQRSPLARHAEAFLGASDRYGLDWRLLPSLAMVETGGLVRGNNNVFGWGNGRIQFGSIGESIQVIAERLTNALPYRNKTTEGKLRAYNPVNKGYAAHVQGVMTSIGPTTPADTATK
jgi:hypothetical protein